MYQTLYRKYRPSNFDEVIGQQVVVKTLKNAILNKKLTHAYLFTGPRGTGKTSIAKIFAKTINCSNLNETNPCNACESCLQILSKKSIDIIEIDAASNNGVDEIRELRSKASLVPTVGKYKVYIIDEVHMLTQGAFNALLKTLEEPPSHIVFILATTEPHKIPTTIISRCQKFDFKKIAKEDIVTKLKYIIERENVIVDENAYDEIAIQSDGCMRDALSILDQVIAFSDNHVTLEDVHEINGTLPELELIEFIKNMKEQKYEQTFYKIEQYENIGKNYIKLTEEFMSVLRNILLFINIPNCSFDRERKKTYTEIVSIFTMEEIMEYIKKMNEYLFEMKKTNNVRILFEMMIVSLMQKRENVDFLKKEIIEKEKKEISLSNLNEPQKVEMESSISEEKENIVETFSSLEERNVSQSEIQNNVEVTEKIRELQQVRINNTLYGFNKQKMIEIKNKIEDVKKLLLDAEYSNYASMILDAEIKVASEDHIVFLCKNERMEMEFLQNLPYIDITLEKVFGKKMIASATNSANWAIIKNEFNNKLKKYEWMEEADDIKKYYENQEIALSMIDNIFKDIVEYS